MRSSLTSKPSATGLRRRKGVGTYRTRKEAEAAERKALDARDRGFDIAPAKPQRRGS